jgi:hypothetical protein
LLELHAGSAPNLVGGGGDQVQLGAFVCLSNRISGNGRGKAALRKAGEPVEIDVARGVMGASV